MDSETGGRRERKRLATHQALRAAALRLSAERGIREVTVEEIASAADVSTRTFYDHFATKDDAVVGFDEWRVERLRSALRARPADESPLEALRAVLGDLLEESRGEWPLRMRAIANEPALLSRLIASFAGYERAMIEVVAERTGLDRDHDPYPALVTAVATGALRASMATWRANGSSADARANFDAAIAAVMAGLVAPTGERGQ